MVTPAPVVMRCKSCLQSSQIAAADFQRLAGKKWKCPKCGTEVAIKASGQSAPRQPAPPQPASRPSAPATPRPAPAPVMPPSQPAAAPRRGVGWMLTGAIFLLFVGMILGAILTKATEKIYHDIWPAAAAVADAADAADDRGGSPDVADPGDTPPTPVPEADKPKPGEPGFDGTDRKATTDWAERILADLMKKQKTQNAVAFADTLKAARQDLKKHRGAAVKWKFNVSFIYSDHVEIRSTAATPSGKFNVFRGSLDENTELGLISPRIHIDVGKEISRDIAKTLSQGDTVLVSGTIQDIDITEDEFIGTAILYVSLSSIRAEANSGDPYIDVIADGDRPGDPAAVDLPDSDPTGFIPDL